MKNGLMVFPPELPPNQDFLLVELPEDVLDDLLLGFEKVDDLYPLFGVLLGAVDLLLVLDEDLPELLNIDDLYPLFGVLKLLPEL